jgi:hypothetical protein
MLRTRDILSMHKNTESCPRDLKAGILTEEFSLRPDMLERLGKAKSKKEKCLQTPQSPQVEK